MKYCSKCGNQMEDSMLFCQECGTKFVVTTADNPKVDSLPRQNSFETTTYNQSASEPFAKPGKSVKASVGTRKGMKCLMVLCLVCAIIYIVAGRAIDPSMAVGMGGFCIVLAAMFWVLAHSPKEKPRIMGKDVGLTKKKFVLLSILVAFFVVCVGVAMSDPTATHEEDTQQPTETVTENTEAKAEVEAEETPDIALSTEFEKAVWKIAKDNGGKLVSIESIDAEDVIGTTVIAAIVCENDETVVTAILEAIAEETKNNDTNESSLINFGDIEEGDNGAVLVMAAVYDDGTLDVKSTSLDYNSARNAWIKSQFSVWDGSHRELENLIIKNLNDEKSYKHIETNYRSIDDDDDCNEINELLKEAGYSNRVEVGDLFLSTQFSAKNAFGGTIKNIAYGIASYNNNTITLIAIE